MEFSLKDLLDQKVQQYNHFSFVATDPIQIPKQFSRKENIEIAAFLSASIAWGNRKAIIKSAGELMQMMENDPYNFLMDTGEKDWNSFLEFKYRTFNGEDCLFFLRSVKNIYEQHGGLEAVFTEAYKNKLSIEYALSHFRNIFFEVDFMPRSAKHVANVNKGSAAKRLNLFLKWMVRKDDIGVDFGLWENIPMSALKIPLDVHSGRQARKLGLLIRNQNDWKAVNELTNSLRNFDPDDPVKYDYALFGLGVFE